MQDSTKDLVDDLFARPAEPAAAPSVAAAPLVDALFGASASTVVSTHSLRDNVFGELTAPSQSRTATAAPAAAAAGGEASGAGLCQHLLFLVHGIGEHQDFFDDKVVSWDGSEGGVGGNHEFRELLASLASSRLTHAPLSLLVSSVEWHSALRADGDVSSGGESGSDALVNAVCPPGVTGLRSFTRDNVMDVLYYTSVAHAQLIVDTVADRIQKRWSALCRERPGWCGSVHPLRSLALGRSCER